MRVHAAANPDAAVFQPTFSEEPHMKLYYEDELELTCPLLAQTLVSAILDIPERNQEHAKEYSVPFHASSANKDDRVSKTRLQEFFDKISTSEDKKQICHYDSDHFLFFDGLLFEEFIGNQIKWVNSLF